MAVHVEQIRFVVNGAGVFGRCPGPPLVGFRIEPEFGDAINGVFSYATD